MCTILSSGLHFTNQRGRVEFFCITSIYLVAVICLNVFPTALFLEISFLLAIIPRGGNQYDM